MLQTEPKLIPIPFSLDELSPGTLVRYLCPFCQKTITHNQNNAERCSHCECPLDWRELPEHCSEEFRDKFLAVKNRKRVGEREKNRTDRLLEMSKLLTDFYHEHTGDDGRGSLLSSLSKS